MKYNCEKCGQTQNKQETKLFCEGCNITNAVIENGVVVFSGCEQKTDFFDKQSVEKLGMKYSNYDLENFRSDLDKIDLSNMDNLNKKVGITTKFWWEKYTGKIEGKNILEVGCGVNYIVPYWLYSNNNVAAFDVSQEAVFLLKKVVDVLELPKENLDLFVCDVERLNIDMRFDIISINNVLHHIENIKEVLLILMDMLFQKLW